MPDAEKSSRQLLEEKSILAKVLRTRCNIIKQNSDFCVGKRSMKRNIKFIPFQRIRKQLFPEIHKFSSRFIGKFTVVLAAIGCFFMLPVSLGHSTSVAKNPPELCQTIPAFDNCLFISQTNPVSTPISTSTPKTVTFAEATETPVTVQRNNNTLSDTQLDLIRQMQDFYGGATPAQSIITILFLTIGPLKIIPSFIQLTVNADDALRKKMAIRSFALSTVSIVVVALIGHNFLINYDIPVQALKMAAGIVLFRVALPTVLSQYAEQGNPAPPQEPGLNMVISPLTFPTILTPFGIAIVIVIATFTREFGGDLKPLLGVILVLMVLNLLSMLYARPILNFLKPAFLQVVGLILGIIQLALAISMIFSAIRIELLFIWQIMQS